MEKKFTFRIKTKDGGPFPLYLDSQEDAEAVLKNLEVVVKETSVELSPGFKNLATEKFAA